VPSCRSFFVSARSASQPVAINVRRQIVGYTVPTGEAGYPILWQNGVTTRLPFPAGTVWAVPEDINVFGDIAGIAALADEFSSPRAMVWRRGQPVVLAMFPGGFIQAAAINDWGLVAGIADDGVRVEAPPDEELSAATDMNNLGDAVGAIGTATQFTGVVWLRRS
jgi:uncharacterized membrane protein